VDVFERMKLGTNIYHSLLKRFSRSEVKG